MCFHFQSRPPQDSLRDQPDEGRAAITIVAIHVSNEVLVFDDLESIKNVKGKAIGVANHTRHTHAQRDRERGDYVRKR